MTREMMNTLKYLKLLEEFLDLQKEKVEKEILSCVDKDELEMLIVKKNDLDMLQVPNTLFLAKKKRTFKNILY